MTENIFIFGFFILNWILFLFVHIILLRSSSHRDVFKSLSRSIIIPPLISAGVLCIIWGIWRFPLAVIIFSFVISVLLWLLSCAIYIFCAFGIIESSIRIRILTTIVREGEWGMTEKKLKDVYNTRTIIRKRIDRFIHSGELVRTGEKISRGRRGSLAQLPAFMFHIFWVLYRNDPWCE